MREEQQSGIQLQVSDGLVKKSAPRIVSIDLLRGLTVALMILVNDPGDPQCVYRQLDHAEWNGYTLADLVFPNFLFLAGASLVFSLESRIKRLGQGESRWEMVRGMLRRAANLTGLKLFVAVAPTFRVRRVRIFGVLFRTALLGLAGGLVLMATLSVAALLAISASLLAGYWLLLRVPMRLGGEELNVPLLDADANLTAYVDRWMAHLFHGHLHSGALYNVTHDPEGLLSSLPALATVLHGAVAAKVMRSSGLTPERKAGGAGAGGRWVAGCGDGLGAAVSGEQKSLDELVRAGVNGLVADGAGGVLLALWT